MITINQLSKILYTHDLMGTGCVPNDAFDEYDVEAKNIIVLLKQGFPFNTALNYVFSFFFYPNCLCTVSHLVALVEVDYYNTITKY